MSRPRNRASTARCRSRHSTSKTDIIASQKQYLRQWNDVGLKPVKNEIEYALRQTTVDHEKAINTINGAQNKAVEIMKKFFKPLIDVISEKNRKTRKNLKEKKQKFENVQNRLEAFIQQEDFDKNDFVEKAERLKLETGQLAIKESVICVPGVEINMVQKEVDKFHQHFEQFLKQFYLYDMFGVEETKQEFKARISTPPELCSSPDQPQPSLSTNNLTLTPHPPSHVPRARSACTNNRRSQMPSSASTLKSIETVEDTRSRRSELSPLHRSLPSCVTKVVNSGNVKPTISVSPLQVVANDHDSHQGMERRLNLPYSVGVLSNGNKVVVETDALKIIDNDSKKIVQNTNMYNRDEAKATGCCDLTVLKNDNVIVCDSQRKKLLLVRPDSDVYEIFMEFERTVVPRAITNDGTFLYICLCMESGDGVLRKIDIETKREVGHHSFPRPPMTASSPKYVAINSRQEILVSDALNGILWFIDEGSKVHSFTNACITGLTRPTGICWLSLSQFAVAVQDVNHHRLLVVDIPDVSHIRVINTFGQRGNQPNVEFNSPEGMTMHQGYGHDELLVCDLMNSRLNYIPLSYLEDSSSV